ncbi:Hypothetical predicted protein [Cloeon dipterum]|uniref:Uncharacterized protein n=1 Tax=Cloeon dipterum TaxID=197152 RepID=A0A8S1DF06_9INSE|nr:Hypothetical predicted protein [Cloeon dipterum]
MMNNSRDQTLTKWTFVIKTLKKMLDILAAVEVIVNSSLSNDKINADVLKNTEAGPKKSHSWPTLQKGLNNASNANSLKLIEKELKKLVEMITTDEQSQTTETGERLGPKMLNQLDAPKYYSGSSNLISVVNNLDSPDPPKDAFSVQDGHIEERRRTLKRYPGMTNLREIIDGVKIDVNVGMDPANIQPSQTGEKKLNSLEESPPTVIERISSRFVAAMKRITCCK